MYWLLPALVMKKCILIGRKIDEIKEFIRMNRRGGLYENWSGLLSGAVG